MRKLKINKGDIFNRLTIIKEVKQRGIHRFFLCKCNCGTKKEISLGKLRNKTIKSCGCLKKEILIKNSFKLTHGMSFSRIYKCWRGIKDRCYNIKLSCYKNYGGRGITVCKEWLESFETFYNDMGNPPKGKSMDRINNDGNYCKENCKWSTSKEQNNNRRDRKS